MGETNSGGTVGSKPQSIEIQAVIIRKDGTIENLGTVSYYNRNVFKNLFWKLKNALRAFFKRGV